MAVSDILSNRKGLINHRLDGRPRQMADSVKFTILRTAEYGPILKPSGPADGRPGQAALKTCLD